MARKTKRDWLIEGLHILAELDVTQLKIDVLTKRLDVTKGSFYHHFKNYQDYKQHLLDFFVEEGTLQIIDTTEAAESAKDKFIRLITTSVGYPPDVEIAIRAWALQDPLVRTYQERIDQQRITYVKTICIEMGYDQERALHLAQMFYALYVGSQQMLPPLDAKTSKSIFFDIAEQFGVTNLTH